MSEYEDKAEIIELLNLYAFALDSHRWELFDRIFTDDVTADYGGAEWPTRAELVNAFDEIHARLDSHQHTIMGHLVHVDGDRAYAFTYGNWLLIKYATEGGPTWLGTGWYDDELIRTDRGWRIKHRISRIISYSGNLKIPQLPEPASDQAADQIGQVLSREVGGVRYFNAITAK